MFKFNQVELSAVSFNTRAETYFILSSTINCLKYQIMFTNRNVCELLVNRNEICQRQKNYMMQDSMNFDLQVRLSNSSCC